MYLSKEIFFEKQQPYSDQRTMRKAAMLGSKLKKMICN